MDKNYFFEEWRYEINKKAKRVVLISPDFFPRVVSPVSVQVKRISEVLADKGIDTHIIAYDPLKADSSDEMGGVKIHYIGHYIRTYSPLTWSLTLSMDVNRKVSDIYHDEGPIDIIHSHDWTTFPSGIKLHRILNRPFVSNFYSIESWRSWNTINNYTLSVRNIEFKAGKESDKLYTINPWLKNEIVKEYNVDVNKVDVLDNGNPKSFKSVISDYNSIMKAWREQMRMTLNG